MSKCLASWFCDSIKESAKLMLNKVCNILSMVNNIVLNNSGENNTKSTFILKASTKTLLDLLFKLSSIFKIHISALLIKSFNGFIYIFPLVNPALLIATYDDLI
jgi:hypothetical protein